MALYEAVKGYAFVAVTPHGVSPRDSHEFSPTIGGVHKLMILLRDLLKEQIQKIFGKDMGGVRGTQTPLWYVQNHRHQGPYVETFSRKN